MNIHSLVLDSIDFEPYCVSNEVAAVNKLSNILLLPAQHLLHGRSVHGVRVPTGPHFDRVVYETVEQGEDSGLVGLLKNIVSIVLFIPGTILGTALRGVTFLCSEKLRERYQDVEEAGLEDPVNRAVGDVAIALFREDSGRLLKVLTELKDKDKLNDFFAAFTKDKLISRSSGNIAYLTKYKNLYPEQYGENFKKHDIAISKIMAGFMSLYANGKVQQQDFFKKLALLDEHAGANNSSFTVHSILSSNAAAVSAKIESVLAVNATFTE